MRLDDNYTIEQDPHNIILRYEKEGDINPKTGKPTITKHEYYYKDVQDALKAYINKSIDVNEDVESVLERLSHAMERVKSFYEQNGK